MSNEKLPKEIKNPKIVEPKMRQIIIETDGNNIKIVKADVSGNLEFLAVLNTLIQFLSNKK